MWSLKQKSKTVIFALCLISSVCVGCGKNNSAEDTTGNDADKLIQDTGIVNLKVNYLDNPLGIDEPPVFSWQSVSGQEDVHQSDYRIVVAKDNNLEAVLWDSGYVASDVSVGIPLECEVSPETRYYWKVYTKYTDGANAESEISSFETGIMDAGWDGAAWIAAEYPAVSRTENIECISIHYDIELESGMAGLTWGASEGRYDSYYLVAIDLRHENPQISVSQRNREKTMMEQSFLLADSGISTVDFEQFPHAVDIEADSSSMHVYVDSVEIGQIDFGEEGIEQSALYAGQIGTWVTRGEYYGYFDNISVAGCGTDGEVVLYDEDFENTTNIFSPYYTEVVDGRLRAHSGYMTVPGGEKPAPTLSKAFEIDSDKEVADARLYISALGIYDASVNGMAIDDAYLSPGASFYGKRAYYRTIDIKDLVASGTNVIDVVLGHGRFDRVRQDWGNDLGLMARLVVSYADGSTDVIVSDDTWKCYTDGPIRIDDYYWGEFYDARNKSVIETPADRDWDKWSSVKLLDSSSFEYVDNLSLCAAEYAPVREIAELKPVSVSEPVSGTYVYDFGENITGVCELKDIAGQAGDVITIRYSELLNDEKMESPDGVLGTVFTENLLTAADTDYYVCAGANDYFLPRFTWRGFRYVQITGLGEALPVESVSAKVLSVDIADNGYFECSNQDLNRLYEAIKRTQKNNYIDIPMDCPQRDERFGWTGDVQVFGSTATFNSDTYQYLRAFLTAMRDVQREDGSYADMAYTVSDSGGHNGWGDAGITLTYLMYTRYADIEIVKENMESMCKYMDYLIETSTDWIRYDDGSYGDHNATSGAEKCYVDTVQCARNADLLTKMCELLGDTQGAAYYGEIFDNYRNAWLQAYVSEGAATGGWLQDEYALPLAYGLYPEDMEVQAAANLNMVVESGGYLPSTGYVATPVLLRSLSDYGYVDSAYALLQQEQTPSWLGMLGAEGTTITEEWQTRRYNEDGTYRINGSMDHAALGSVGAWYYEGILGIKEDISSPGFKHFFLNPCVGGGLESASGYYDSIYGRITSSWEVQNGEVVYEFTIPANTSATVDLAGMETMELGSGTYRYTTSK